MEKIRVGVVGCGLVAQIAHLPYLQELSHLFEIRALCTTSPDRLDELAGRYNVPGRYVDYRELLDQDLDAVFVLTRDHAEIAVSAAERGMHVFVEKPIAFNLDQADEMISHARQHGVKLMVGYMRRFDPGLQRAQEIFGEMTGDRLIRVHSSVGSPFRIVKEMYDLVPGSEKPEKEATMTKAREDAAFLQGIGPERAHLVRAYNLLLQVWSHNLNFLRGCFGEPKKVNHAEVQLGARDAAPPGVTKILAVLDFGSQDTCIWETKAFVANESWDEELAVFGDERTVKVTIPFPYLKHVPLSVRVEETIGGALVHQDIVTSYDEAYKRELRHFHDCIVNDREPLTNGEDARKDLELAVRMIDAVT